MHRSLQAFIRVIWQTPRRRYAGLLMGVACLGGLALTVDSGNEIVVIPKVNADVTFPDQQPPVVRFLQQVTIGNQRLAKKTLHIQPLETINLVGDIDARITIGDKASATIIADNNVLDLVQVQQKQNTLLLAMNRYYISPNRVKIFITLPKVAAASTAGSGSLVLRHLKSEQLSLKSVGTGRISVAGHVEKLVVSLGEGSQLEASGLQATHVTINMARFSDATLQAEKTIEGNVDSGAMLDVYGSPVKDQLHQHAEGFVSFTSKP